MSQRAIIRINQSAVRLMEPLSLEEVCERSVNEACKLFNARDGSIFWAVDGKLKRLFSTIPLEQQFDPSPHGNTMKVFTTLKPRYMSFQELEKKYPEILKTGIRSYTLIPLSYSQKSLGVMVLQSTLEHTDLELNRNNLKLYGRLVSLAIRNVQLYEQKQEALNQRDLFMSLASHELKTPLAVVIMTLHLIERTTKNGNELNPKWVDTIKRNANKLKTLIDDLFSISQINAGAIRIRRSKFSLIETCEKIISELKVVYPQRIKLTNKLREKEALLFADEDKISLVLTNILSNAAKFSPTESVITMTLKLKGKGVSVSIKDKGVGIDPLDQKKVFERYFQGKNRRNGLGLGLFLSKEIIEAHDGEVALKSKRDEGTTVSIWLPSSHDTT